MAEIKKTNNDLCIITEEAKNLAPSTPYKTGIELKTYNLKHVR